MPGFRELAAPNLRTPGTLSTLPGEMKQVTVLFCDIVNSTPLTERLGAEGMRDLVHEFLGSSLAIGKPGRCHSAPDAHFGCDNRDQRIAPFLP
jgi:hypothetical protein